MEWLQYIIPIAGNIGWVIGIVILYQTGVLGMLLKKNGNGDSELLKQLGELKNNHLHEVSDTLKRIEENQSRDSRDILIKLGEISESVVYIKARVNGK